MANPRKKHRVLVVGPGANCKGGITTVIRNYGKSSFWAEFGCVHFSSTRDGSQAEKLVYVIHRCVVFLWVILTEGPTAISLHTSHGSSFYRKMFYLVVSRILRIPVVLHIHPAGFMDFYRRGSRLRQWLVRLAARLSNRVVFLSALQMEAFAEIFPKDKLIVVGNPVDVSAFSSWHSDWCREPCQVLYLGWIIREKGVYDLVDAIPEVARQYPRASFVFGGTKEIERLDRLIAQRGLGAHAKVAGWVEGEERLRLLHTSRMLILPSYSEGVPNVLLEAMAAGVPVIVTPVGGVPSIVQDGMTGIYVQPGDIGAIAEAICRLLGDSEECQRLADNAHREVARRFDIEVIAGQLRQIYGDLA